MYPLDQYSTCLPSNKQLYLCVCVCVGRVCEGWRGAISIHILFEKRKGDPIILRVFFKIYTEVETRLGILPAESEIDTQCEAARNPHTLKFSWTTLVCSFTYEVGKSKVSYRQITAEMKKAVWRYKGQACGIQSN